MFIFAESGPMLFEDLPEDIVEPGMILPIWLLVAILFAAMLIAAIGIFFLVMLIQKSTKRRPPVPVLAPPREEALQKLTAMEGQLPGMNASQTALVLTEAVKRFLERQYGADLKSQTTDEYVRSLDHWDKVLPGELAEPLAQFFGHCDSLKFQGYNDEAGKRELLTDAVTIVRTLPQPVATQS